MEGAAEMVHEAGIVLGDVIFILVVCAVIYGIMALVNRARKNNTNPPGDKEGT
jgi:hypothetical protein